MPAQMSKSEVVSIILARLDLDESQTPWLTIWMKVAATRMRMTISTASKQGLPLSPPHVPLLEMLIRLADDNKITRYHIIRTIEAHFDAYIAAAAEFRRTTTLFASDLERTDT